MWGILNDMVKAGIDDLNPIEVIAGMDVGELRRKYPRLTLMDGIDYSLLLSYGTEEQVEAAVKKAIDEGWTGGGLLLGSGTEIHPDCKVENVLKMSETIRTYGSFEKAKRIRFGSIEKCCLSL